MMKEVNKNFFFHLLYSVSFHSSGMYDERALVEVIVWLYSVSFHSTMLIQQMSKLATFISRYKYATDKGQTSAHG